MRHNSRARFTAALLSVLGVAILGAPSSVAGAGLPGQGFLPDNRGYELVSAPDKNGGDVAMETSRVRIAADGSAVSYSSLAGFGDSVGGAIGTEYMAQRGAGGWATHAISPPQQAFSFQALAAGLDSRYEGDLSSDLSTGVLRAWKPLTDEDANVVNVANLYLRSDLRTPGGGEYQLITACPLCVSSFPTAELVRRPRFIDATPDFGKILFESELNLAPGAAGGSTKLYEWDHGTVRLAGVLPDGTPALRSGAGYWVGPEQNRYSTHNSISEDGSKVFFTALVGGVQNLYMRLDGTSTVQLNASETAPTTASEAHYYDASVSGSRVFFTSSQVLTDDAKDGGGPQLYMYDTTKPASDPHNLTYLNVDNEPADQASNVVAGVVGASADGSAVYFFGFSQLVPGAPPGAGLPLFVWHEGELSYVHHLTPDDQLSITFDSDPGLGNGKQSTVTPAGDLLYRSNEPVGPDGQDHGSCGSFTGACYEAYVYTLATHQLSCASCSPNGAPAAGDATFMVDGPGRGGASRGFHLNRTISDDGRRVFFTTPSALVPEDTNGTQDAYLYDVPTGTPHLLSSGTDSSPSFFLESSPSGEDAIFGTREQLVGWDRDGNYDLYDARVGGGFPEPPPPQPVCLGDACKDPIAAAPDALTPPSSQLRGAGDPKINRRSPCLRKVRHKGKARCVKKRGGKRANNNRRPGR